MVLKGCKPKVLNLEKHLNHLVEDLIIHNFMLMERQKYLVYEKMEHLVRKALEEEDVTKKGQRNYGTYKKYFK